jgi:predicted O-methyltransferase YrrM
MSDSPARTRQEGKDLRDGVLKPFRSVEPPPATGIRRIELDYEVHPRPRPLRSGPGGLKLLRLLEGSLPGAEALVREIARFDGAFRSIPLRSGPGSSEPSWRNDWFPALDAMMLYGLLALRNPRHYLEVGSGNSTLFARRAIRDHGLRTQIVSIDPSPRAEVDAICDTVLRQPLEDVDLALATRLTREDLVFVDSSHRSFQNSDVTVFFTEVLPALPPGLVYGLHDILLPDDYPPEWRERLYSEQYLLSCYLAGGGDGDRIVAPLSYLANETDLAAPLAATFDHLGLAPELRNGTSFWLQRAVR